MQRTVKQDSAVQCMSPRLCHIWQRPSPDVLLAIELAGCIDAAMVPVLRLGILDVAAAGDGCYLGDVDGRPAAQGQVDGVAGPRLDALGGLAHSWALLGPHQHAACTACISHCSTQVWHASWRLL